MLTPSIILSRLFVCKRVTIELIVVLILLSKLVQYQYEKVRQCAWLLVLSGFSIVTVCLSVVTKTVTLRLPCRLKTVLRCFWCAQDNPAARFPPSHTRPLTHQVVLVGESSSFLSKIHEFGRCWLRAAVSCIKMNGEAQCVLVQKMQAV